MLELTCGRLVGSWITGTERKLSHIFFPIYASITIGMGVIFLIANRGTLGTSDAMLRKNKITNYCV